MCLLQDWQSLVDGFPLDQTCLCMHSKQAAEVWDCSHACAMGVCVCDTLNCSLMCCLQILIGHKRPRGENSCIFWMCRPGCRCGGREEASGNTAKGGDMSLWFLKIRCRTCLLSWSLNSAAVRQDADMLNRDKKNEGPEDRQHEEAR